MLVLSMEDQQLTSMGQMDKNKKSILDFIPKEDILDFIMYSGLNKKRNEKY